MDALRRFSFVGLPIRGQWVRLDTVLADANSVRTRINHHDKQKLEEYLDSIRDIETRISKEEKWVGVPPATPPGYLKEPGPSLEGKEEIKLIYDLMAAALQVDATRVISYRMPADTFLQSLVFPNWLTR